MEHLDITHLILIGIVIFFAIGSLPKAVKELMYSVAWLGLAIYLAGKFGIIEGLFDMYLPE